jgi:hypothetical protein
MPKTKTEKIEGIQTQIQQLENQRKKLIQEQKKQERATRTRRLIERGAILESLIPGAGELTNEQIKSLLVKALTPVSERSSQLDIAPQTNVSGQCPPEPSAQGTD